MTTIPIIVTLAFAAIVTPIQSSECNKMDENVPYCGNVLTTAPKEHIEALRLLLQTPSSSLQCWDCPLHNPESAYSQQMCIHFIKMALCTIILNGGYTSGLLHSPHWLNDDWNFWLHRIATQTDIQWKEAHVPIAFPWIGKYLDDGSFFETALSNNTDAGVERIKLPVDVSKNRFCVTYGPLDVTNENGHNDDEESNGGFQECMGSCIAMATALSIQEKAASSSTDKAHFIIDRRYPPMNQCFNENLFFQDIRQNERVDDIFCYGPKTYNNMILLPLDGNNDSDEATICTSMHELQLIFSCTTTTNTEQHDFCRKTHEWASSESTHSPLALEHTVELMNAEPPFAISRAVELAVAGFSTTSLQDEYVGFVGMPRPHDAKIIHEQEYVEDPENPPPTLAFDPLAMKVSSSTASSLGLIASSSQDDNTSKRMTYTFDITIPATKCILYYEKPGIADASTQANNKTPTIDMPHGMISMLQMFLQEEIPNIIFNVQSLVLM